MAYTYFGGLDEKSPIPARGTQNFEAVNPYWVQEAAWKWENERRAAERQREMEATIGRPEDVAETTKAIQAAIQFQGVRGFQTDVANGIDPSIAIMKHAPAIMISKPGSIPQLMPQRKPVIASGTIWERNPVTGKFEAQTPIKPPRDPMEENLRKQIANAESRVSKAKVAVEAAKGTMADVKPAYTPGKFLQFFGAKGRPAVTNQIPMVDPMKQAELGSMLDAETRNLDELNSSLKNYLGGRTNAVVAPGPAPVSAPPTAPAAASRREIIRMTKDGRRVVYDADTKEPIRYAD